MIIGDATFTATGTGVLLLEQKSKKLLVNFVTLLVKVCIQMTMVIGRHRRSHRLTTDDSYSECSGVMNTARVEAGSQYAALESAVNYTTDLTAQYELGYNTVNDVNFSMETAHMAKNQILQQAATAMLAQANQGQQGLLQLIQ